ncbi:MAG TPA: clostripain-related cysteine peptidase [Candidatus Babeliales bacterium]|nr:clostripain-related cysteine peptidase [Candidatus Babeliales bacterium]
MITLKKTLYLLFFISISFIQSQSLPITILPWNIVIYMEASAGHLYQAAFKNLNEIMHNTPKNAHVFVFLHTHGNVGWLYHITKNNIHKISELACDYSVAETLINVMTIAIKSGPALHYGLILWNHGYGILNPVYNEETNDWFVPYDGPYTTNCSLKRSLSNKHIYHRGMCVTNNRTFLSNKDMVYAFDSICNKLLNGNKLAFCGMDLCKGAMFEHAYQLRNYTDYLIGSQECEMVDGWPYDKVLQIINDTTGVTIEEMVMHIVTSFHEYYQTYTEQDTYTLSVIDTHYAEILKHNINAISTMLMQMLIHNDQVKSVLMQLRMQCKTFCDAPMYCDLQQWYSTLLSLFDKYESTDKKSEFNSTFKKLLHDGLTIMSHMIVAKCNGSASTHAQGCSIYFPQFAINTSYLTAPFAQESYWVQFLEQFLL